MTVPGSPMKGFDGNRRCDGIKVDTNLDGNWIIIGTKSLPTIIDCPTCQRPFRTRLSAQTAANYLYPVINASEIPKI